MTNRWDVEESSKDWMNFFCNFWVIEYKLYVLWLPMSCHKLANIRSLDFIVYTALLFIGGTFIYYTLYNTSVAIFWHRKFPLNSHFFKLQFYCLEILLNYIWEHYIYSIFKKIKFFDKNMRTKTIALLYVKLVPSLTFKSTKGKKML